MVVTPAGPPPKWGDHLNVVTAIEDAGYLWQTPMESLSQQSVLNRIPCVPELSENASFPGQYRMLHLTAGTKTVATTV